jgi:hypothetical protein
MNTLERFTEISGLKINYTKTLAVKIGLNQNLNYIPENGKEIIWQTEGKFTLLGIKYNLDDEDVTKINYESKIKEFEKTLNLWRARKISMYGKICFIKSLAMPKLIHFSSLPNPSEQISWKHCASTSSGMETR